MVSMMFIMLPRAEASAKRINEVLAVDPEINDAEQVRLAEDTRGYVEFQDVTFSYAGAEEPALSHISFSTAPGEVTAIIGGTGAGKSTLVNLIPRFYDIDSGRILVDGVDIREMAQEHLRAKIGFVPQKAVLFSGTIAENIRYGKEDATDEEVRHAADIAQASDFIEDMADGFDSIIAQGGTNVSGGQKQRLSIARALVRRPEIYVFDDSFSALDFKTDARLRSALKKETRNATVFIVAQRVGTVMDADRIIVLDEGRIAGIGTHRTLMETSEVYREIVSSQLSSEEIEEGIA
ncbi:MAG: ABC transporter ATP-binding protein, partial [Ktedonobacteraceae bacterium]|nr:ABC transporter ATP-binding protein [Ktedonobacteraceae bacterium]